MQESTIYRRRERLRAITDGLGLGSVYGTMIERIKAQDGDKPRLGMEALMWISHAERLLKADELCHALAVQLGSTDFNADNVPLISTVLGFCQGLITVDKEESNVRLIHFTLKEYLSAHPDIFSRPHPTMAEVSLTYLNSQTVKALSTNPSADLSILIHDKPFLEYCSLYWGAHGKKGLSNRAMSLALALFRYDGHISTELLLGWIDKRKFTNFDLSGQFSGIHYASFFGIVELVAALIEMGCYGINEGDHWGYTPLAWAACNGHEEVVKLLLGRREVNPDKSNHYGETPLSCAAQGGYEGMAKLLLGRREVNPDKPNIYRQTPLWYATEGGHEGIVKLLLGIREVDPDKLDIYGQTPLSYATKGGHERIVKLLLWKPEVNPDKSDIHG